jgi:hypothetical protein
VIGVTIIKSAESGSPGQYLYIYTDCTGTLSRTGESSS